MVIQFLTKVHCYLVLKFNLILHHDLSGTLKLVLELFMHVFVK